MKVKELLSSKSVWTKHAMGRDINGNPLITSNMDRACCWCLFGAIMKCYPDSYLKINELVTKEIKAATSFWNDAYTTNFEDVKALVEKLDI